MKLAIYDFDGTIFMKETLPFLIKYYRKHPYSRYYLVRFYVLTVYALIRYKNPLDKTFDKEKFRGTAAGYFMGLFQGLKKMDIVKFFHDSAQEMEAFLNQRVVEDMAKKKAEGFHVVICSGANTLLLNEMKDFLTADTVLGTELYFKQDGAYDFDAPLSVTTGDNKPKAILSHFIGQEIDWEGSYAYGDSYYDHDVLALTGNPVAVHPDERLEAIAKDKGWPIWK